jgi:tetratricopeptide (TPR) repeat protein
MKKRLVILGTTFLGGFLSAQNLQEAITKTENERYELASADYRALIAKEPNKGDNYFFFGENYFKSGEADSANMFYTKGAELNPTYALNYVGIGKVLLNKNDVNAAKTNFFKAASISQNKNAEVFRKIAEAWIATDYKNPDEAITAANTAIKLDAKNPDGYIVLGDALLEKNPADGGGPIKNYKQATTINPKSAKGIIREGKLYQRGRNYQLALEKYKEAMTIDANFAPAYREIAELYFLAGQPAKSIENWKKYLDLNNSDQARYRYMTALFSNKQYADAVKEYEGLKTNGFNNLYLERLAGYSYAEMGDKTDKEAYNKGLAAINNFFKMAPSTFKFLANDYKYKGILLSRTGKDSLAFAEMERAIAFDPAASGEIYSEMALMAYRGKKYDRVVEVVEKKTASGATLNNNDYFNYGRANYNLGQNKLIEANTLKDAKARAAREAESQPYMVKADSAFAGLIRLNPNWPTAYVWKGRSSSLISFDLAKPFYDKVLEKTKPEEKTGSYKRDVVEAYEYLGAYYLNNKDKDNADAMFNALKEIDPNNVKVQNYFNPKNNAPAKTGGVKPAK